MRKIKFRMVVSDYVCENDLDILVITHVAIILEK